MPSSICTKFAFLCLFLASPLSSICLICLHMSQYPSVSHTIAYDVLISDRAISFLFSPFLQEYFDVYFNKNYSCQHIFKDGLSVSKKKEKCAKDTIRKNFLFLCSNNWQKRDTMISDLPGYRHEQRIPFRNEESPNWNSL